MSSWIQQNNGKSLITPMIKSEQKHDDEHSNHSNNSNTTSSSTTTITVPINQLPSNNQQQIPIVEPIYSDSVTLKNLNLVSSNSLQQEQYASTNGNRNSICFFFLF